jgi:hypothetical protein
MIVPLMNDWKRSWLNLGYNYKSSMEELRKTTKKGRPGQPVIGPKFETGTSGIGTDNSSLYISNV